MKEHLKKLFEYNFWANAMVLESLRKTPKTEERIRKIFGHILVAEEIWMIRLQGQKWSGKELFPNPTPQECLELFEKNKIKYEAYLSALKDEGLSRVVSYTSTEGIGYRSAVSEILFHVAIHGGYHRGQIASETRNNGREPLKIDFVIFTRE